MTFLIKVETKFHWRFAENDNCSPVQHIDLHELVQCENPDSKTLRISPIVCECPFCEYQVLEKRVLVLSNVRALDVLPACFARLDLRDFYAPAVGRNGSRVGGLLIYWGATRRTDSCVKCIDLRVPPQKQESLVCCHYRLYIVLSEQPCCLNRSSRTEGVQVSSLQLLPDRNTV